MRRLNDLNILLKLLIIVYIGFSSTVNGVAPQGLISFLLLLIISSTLNYSFYKVNKNIFFVIELFLSLIISTTITVYAYIYLVYIFFEYLIIYKGFYKISIGIYGGIVVIAYLLKLNLEFVSSITLLVILQITMTMNTRRILYLEEKREEDRKINNILRQNLKDNEKYREQSLETLKLQERSEISGKMHDKLGHTVSGALLQLEALKVIINQDRKLSEKMLDNTIEVLRTGMNDIRAILKETKPAKEELGLNKIKLLLEEKIRNTNFHYALINDSNTDLISNTQWALIIDAIRELSTNSIKYSKGNKINVKIEILKSLIKIEIKDNGIGARKIKKGMGLNGLEENVISVKGKLILDGSNGFSAIMLLPREVE